MANLVIDWDAANSRKLELLMDDVLPADKFLKNNIDSVRASGVKFASVTDSETGDIVFALAYRLAARLDGKFDWHMIGVNAVSKDGRQWVSALFPLIIKEAKSQNVARFLMTVERLGMERMLVAAGGVEVAKMYEVPLDVDARPVAFGSRS